MTYDGLGNRLEVTTYTDGEGNTTRYVLDGGTTLTEIGADSSAHYLYGLGVIGTLNESWSYILSDGAGSTRQLVDEEGAVNLSVSYTPWGDTLEIYGSGMLNLGYLGGVYDAGTGLIYMGNGQYYDPSTGRFLTRGAQQDQSNPYTPWNSDPAGMLIAPLALLALVFGRKKNRKRRDDILITILLILTIATSFTMIGESLVQPVVANSVNYDQNNLPVIPSQAYVANNIDSYSEENYLPPVPWDPPTPLPEPDDCTDEDRRAFFKKLVTDSGFALVTQYGSMISPFVRDVFYEFGFIHTEEGYYYTRQDCRQQWGGFNHGYDDIFNYFTDMRTDQFDFTYHGVKLRFWAWKGYYLNLGAGAEMGIYRSWDIAGIPTGHWYVDQTYALRMELRLQHKNGEIIYNYKPREHQWWIAAFHPFYQDVMASDLHARFIVYFDGKTDMYNAFANSIDAPNDKRWVWFPNQNAAIFNFK